MKPRFGYNPWINPQDRQYPHTAVCVCGHPICGAQEQGAWRWLHCGEAAASGQCPEPDFLRQQLVRAA